MRARWETEGVVWKFTSIHYMKSIRMFEGAFFRLLFLRVGCQCNRPSFLVTVFATASIFNRDLNQWDVAIVANMQGSKSILILENDLTRRELILL